MDRLEIPLPLAGVEVEADDAVGEQVGARAMSAVVVARRHLGREIDAVELFVDVIGAQLPALPVYDHESFSQVSLPNSPGCGMVWKIHSRLPVRTSNPRT